ncbi:unnamed protein product [Owenia fusiformis]|uniref:Uncharacterized protein n=1 Tax=Owenia fusiformis TaxID=6347 RepID=A0A8S4NK46_OWEFU|nr:unnamed protein product [Owenia fusiformis]
MGQFCGEKGRVLKNVIVLSTSVMLISVALVSLQDIESTINSSKGIGVLSLCSFYSVTSILPCIVAPVVTDKLGCKWAIVLGIALRNVYTAVHFYATEWALIIGGLIGGMGNIPIWTAGGTMITELAEEYASATATDVEVYVNKFNGVFYSFYQCSHVIGNLISTLCLTRLDVQFDLSDKRHCGMKVCPRKYLQSSQMSQNNEDKKTVYLMVALLLFCGLLAIILAICILDNTPNRIQEEEESRSLIHKRLMQAYDYKSEECDNGARQQEGNTASDYYITKRIRKTLGMMFDKKVLLMTPLMIFTGTNLTWLFTDFTQSFMTCNAGVDIIGRGMIFFGVADTSGSLLVGMVEKYISRYIMFLGAFVINLSIWTSLVVFNPSQIWFLYFVPIMWGFTDAIWETQTSAYIGVTFSQSDVVDVYSIWRSWQYFGYTVYLATTHFFCMSVKVYIQLLLSITMITMFIISEILTTKGYFGERGTFDDPKHMS